MSPSKRVPLQVEDILLVSVVYLVEPLMARWLDVLHPYGLGGGAPSKVLDALLLLLAGVGAAVCIVTRAANGASDGARGGSRRGAAAAFASPAGYTRFPLMVLVALFLEKGLASLGVETGEGLFFAVVIVLSAPLAFYEQLPELALPLRRLLVTPTILAGSAMFSAFVDDVLDGGAILRDLPARDDPTFTYAVFVLSILLFGTLAFYVLLVIAPRKVAGEPGGTGAWTLRFLVFLAALLLNLTLPFSG